MFAGGFGRNITWVEFMAYCTRSRFKRNSEAGDKRKLELSKETFPGDDEQYHISGERCPVFLVIFPPVFHLCMAGNMCGCLKGKKFIIIRRSSSRPGFSSFAMLINSR